MRVSGRGDKGQGTGVRNFAGIEILICPLPCISESCFLFTSGGGDANSNA